MATSERSISSTELAWAAGFYDGEGSTGVTRRQLVLTLKQVDPRPIQRLIEALRVGRLLGPYERPDPNQRPIHGWRVFDNEAKAALDLMWPYLSEPKREQAELALARWEKARVGLNVPLSDGIRRSWVNRRLRAQGIEPVACSRGHVLAEVGRTKGGECRGCTRDRVKRSRQRRAALAVLVVAAGLTAEPTFAHLPGRAMCSAKQPAKVELQCGKRAYFHGLGEARWIRAHALPRPSPLVVRLLAGERAQEVGQLGRLADHLWLMKQGQEWIAEARKRLAPPVPPDCVGATAAACAWYFDGATQCEVAHEGGFTSVSPDGTYHGRFQMDHSFQTETTFGAQMEARYGEADRWPHGAQIQHAFEVWSYSGWGRWPPYYKYGCSSYHGGAYVA